MLTTNLDLVARIYEEFNETRELPRWAMSSNVEWYPPTDEPDNAPRHGVEVVTAYVREWAATFTDYWCDVEELIERDDSVIAPLHLHGRIGASSGELTIPLTQVWTIRDGHVIRVQEYRTKAEALANG